MKIDYLPELTDGGKYKHVVAEQIVRIWDFGYEEAQKLRQLILERIVGNNERLDIAEIPFIEQVSCHLIFEIADDDYGLITTDGFNFICKLTHKHYASRRFIGAVL